MMAAKIGELTSIVERWYDRLDRAVEQARSRDYSADQFAVDVAESWVDLTYGMLLPWSWVGQIDVNVRPVLPVIRFDITAKVDVTKSIAVKAPAAAIAAQSANLTAGGGAKIIPAAAHVSAALASGYLFVKLHNLAAVPAAATMDVYEAIVVAMPGATQIARLRVFWPG
jgi:hypothetical protein